MKSIGRLNRNKARYAEIQTMSTDEVFQAARGAGNLEKKDLDQESNYRWNYRWTVGGRGGCCGLTVGFLTTINARVFTRLSTIICTVYNVNRLPGFLNSCWITHEPSFSTGGVNWPCPAVLASLPLPVYVTGLEAIILRAVRFTGVWWVNPISETVFFFVIATDPTIDTRRSFTSIIVFATVKKNRRWRSNRNRTSPKIDQSMRPHLVMTIASSCIQWYYLPYGVETVQQSTVRYCCRRMRSYW